MPLDPEAGDHDWTMHEVADEAELDAITQQSFLDETLTP